MMHGDQEGAQDPGGANDAETGAGETPPDMGQMVDAISKVLEQLSQMQGPGAEEFAAAYQAFQAGLAKMGQGPSGPQSEQAGANPNAQPMR